MKRLVTALFLLAGCSGPIIAPHPQQTVAGRFTASVPSSDETLDVDWWSRIGDPQLTELLVLAKAGNPDLRTAAAQVMAARARAGQETAAQWPTVSGEAADTKADSDATAKSNERTATLDASWEVDLLGKAARTAQAESARAQAEEFAFAGAYVALAADVADTYAQYRACRMAEQVYRDAVSSQGETIDATSRLVQEGLRAGADLALARASKASAQILLDSQVADCRVMAQTLAVLAGQPQNRIDDILARGSGLPATRGFRVTSVPADMLRRRPDIAEAEAGLTAAMLDLGAARADLYPALKLAGELSLGSPSGWSFGPTLSLSILDGKQRETAVKTANADAITAAETYRSTVLLAVSEAEGALTRLSAANKNLTSAGTLVKEYQSYFKSVDADWVAGGVSLLDREEARRQVQSARITQINQQLAVARQWIALYKAMGGGWTRPAAETAAASTISATPNAATGG